MSDIVNIDDYRPHVTVKIGTGAVVIPVHLIDDISKGATSIAEMDDPETVAQAIAAIAMAGLNK